PSHLHTPYLHSFPTRRSSDLIRFHESTQIRSPMNDIRFALRKLRQTPAFTFIAIVTLALGIGLNTTIFSLINDLFLRGLPFKEPDRKSTRLNSSHVSISYAVF